MSNDGLVKMRVLVDYQGGEASREGGMVKAGSTIRVSPARAEELEKRYKVAERDEGTDAATATADEPKAAKTAAKRH